MGALSTVLNQLPSAFKWGAPIGVVAGVAKAFEWLDGAMSPEGRLRLSNWLRNVPGDEQLTTWPNVLPSLIDRVFGPKPASLKFFLRSCVASLIAVAATLAINVTIYGVRELATYAGIGSLFFLFAIALLAIGFNFVPDYLSVLISRAIVGMMAKRPTFLNVLRLLLIDTFLTVATAVLSLFIWCSIVSWKIPGFGDISSGPAIYELKVAWSVIDNLRFDPTFRIYVLASLFTSVWVWLYVLASASIRTLRGFRFVWVKIVPFLDLEKEPMKAIGRVAGIIMGLLFAAALAVIWLFQRLS
jgi:hypothetical protein